MTEYDFEAFDNMEICHQLRREVVAYVAEHYEPEKGNAEEIWDEAVEHAMGPELQTRPEEWIRNPEKVDPGEMEKHVRVSIAAMEILKAITRLDENETDHFSPEVTAAWAVKSRMELWQESGIGPTDFEMLDSVSQQQELYWMVNNWLANVRGGPMDATGAFHELEREEE